MGAIAVSISLVQLERKSGDRKRVIGARGQLQDPNTRWAANAGPAHVQRRDGMRRFRRSQEPVSSVTVREAIGIPKRKRLSVPFARQSLWFAWQQAPARHRPRKCGERPVAGAAIQRHRELQISVRHARIEIDRDRGALHLPVGVACP